MNCIYQHCIINLTRSAYTDLDAPEGECWGLKKFRNSLRHSALAEVDSQFVQFDDLSTFFHSSFKRKTPVVVKRGKVGNILWEMK